MMLHVHVHATFLIVIFEFKFVNFTAAAHVIGDATSFVCMVFTEPLFLMLKANLMLLKQ